MDKKENAPTGRAPQAKVFSDKDNYKSQYSKVLEAFSTPKTMLMVARETGIERANICRYVQRAVEIGVLFFVSYSLCAITLHKAGFYTTDKSLVHKPMQLELFEDFVEEDSNEPKQLGDAMIEAGRLEVCPRTGEESLLFVINKMKGGAV